MQEHYVIYLVIFRTNAGGVVMKGTMLVFARDAPEASSLAEAEVQRVIVGAQQIVLDDVRLLPE